VFIRSDQQADRTCRKRFKKGVGVYGVKSTNKNSKSEGNMKKIVGCAVILILASCSDNKASFSGKSTASRSSIKDGDQTKGGSNAGDSSGELPGDADDIAGKIKVEDDDLNKPDDKPNPPGLPPISPAALANLCKSTNVQSTTTTVKILANTGAACPFGKDDNLPETQGILTARISKEYPILIPKNYYVCSMSFDAGSQEMRYDDHLILTLNNNLLVSSTIEANALLTGANGFKQYDWKQIVGKNAGDSNSFCGTTVDCEIPRTEQVGRFRFSIKPEANAALFSSLIGKDLSFGLTMIGDNDIQTDCQMNTNLDLRVSYTYVTK
jgi:hypothetical protein